MNVDIEINESIDFVNEEHIFVVESIVRGYYKDANSIEFNAHKWSQLDINVIYSVEVPEACFWGIENGDEAYQLSPDIVEDNINDFVETEINDFANYLQSELFTVIYKFYESKNNESLLQ